MSKFAPARFVLFVVLLVAGIALFMWLISPLKGVMAGFDFAALVFLISCLPLLDDDIKEMRRHAKENDANRAGLLVISVAVTTVILVTVGAVIVKARELHRIDAIIIIATLSLAWLFGNVIYAFHYAHEYYSADDDHRGDRGGIVFPGTREPDYWDFLYFSFTLGMTFQTSDCDVESSGIRKIMIGHCLAAFIFNLGVLAFTINALGS